MATERQDLTSRRENNLNSFGRRFITILISVAAVLAAATLFVIAFIYNYTSGEDSHPSNINKLMKVVDIDGERYLKKDVTTYLVMGIDKYGDMQAQGSEQSDFLALVVVDKDTESFSIVHINRDSMVYAWVYSNTIGKYYKYTEMQICLSHAYGGTSKQRCENTRDAVTTLFLNYDIIDYYVAISMDAIGYFVDLVDGVPITLDTDADLTSLGPTWIPGTTVTLTGENAEKYIRARSSVGDGTNLGRMNRQKNFMESYLRRVKEHGINTEITEETLKQANNIDTDLTITHINYVYKNLKDYRFNGYFVPDGVGYHYWEEGNKGKKYYEWYVDEDSVKNIVLDLYYEKL